MANYWECDMPLSEKQNQALSQFLDKLASDVYPEFPSELHAGITQRMLDYFLGKWKLAEGARVLDVGCGQGAALDLFRQHGFDATGVTLGLQDVAACRAKGYDVYEMDQSFLDFDAQAFDFLWCRHCLEHSIFPYFTLSGFHRVLRPGGYLYVEVPAPDTVANHQKNANHYSVLGKSMWLELMTRSGFAVLDVVDVNFNLAVGPDTYWAFILRRT